MDRLTHRVHILEVNGPSYRLMESKKKRKHPRVVCPVCLAGERACPPEDCGGPWGYQEMLEVLKDSEHEDYEHYFEWVGDGFNAEEFDVGIVNGCLSE